MPSCALQTRFVSWFVAPLTLIRLLTRGTYWKSIAAMQIIMAIIVAIKRRGRCPNSMCIILPSLPAPPPPPRSLLSNTNTIRVAPIKLPSFPTDQPASPHSTDNHHSTTTTTTESAACRFQWREHHATVHGHTTGKVSGWLSCLCAASPANFAIIMPLLGHCTHRVYEYGDPQSVFAHNNRDNWLQQETSTDDAKLLTGWLTETRPVSIYSSACRPFRTRKKPSAPASHETMIFYNISHTWLDIAPTQIRLCFEGHELIIQFHLSHCLPLNECSATGLWIYVEEVNFVKPQPPDHDHHRSSSVLVNVEWWWWGKPKLPSSSLP